MALSVRTASLPGRKHSYIGNITVQEDLYDYFHFTVSSEPSSSSHEVPRDASPGNNPQPPTVPRTRTTSASPTTVPHLPDPNDVVHCLYVADGHGEVIQSVATPTWRGSCAERFTRALKPVIREEVERTFREAFEKALMECVDQAPGTGFRDKVAAAFGSLKGRLDARMIGTPAGLVDEEGQSRRAVEKDFKMLHEFGAKYGGGPNDGYVTSLKSAYRLGMTNSIGNTNHLNNIFSRTTVYPFDIPELISQTKDGSLVVVLCSDGIKDALRAADVARAFNDLDECIRALSPDGKYMKTAACIPTLISRLRKEDDHDRCAIDHLTSLLRTTSIDSRPDVGVAVQALCDVAVLRGTTDDVTAVALEIELYGGAASVLTPSRSSPLRLPPRLSDIIDPFMTPKSEPQPAAAAIPDAVSDEFGLPPTLPSTPQRPTTPAYATDSTTPAQQATPSALPATLILSSSSAETEHRVVWDASSHRWRREELPVRDVEDLLPRRKVNGTFMPAAQRAAANANGNGNITGNPNGNANGNTNGNGGGASKGAAPVDRVVVKQALKRYLNRLRGEASPVDALATSDAAAMDAMSSSPPSIVPKGAPSALSPTPEADVALPPVTPMAPFKAPSSPLGLGWGGVSPWGAAVVTAPVTSFGWGALTSAAEPGAATTGFNAGWAFSVQEPIAGKLEVPSSHGDAVALMGGILPNGSLVAKAEGANVLATEDGDDSGPADENGVEEMVLG
ncbi:hypothetical protein HK101_001312 [Irineochytrium annulatum]|nr:hypothetical protein HK101_001312 [Irineochytrium annulatum]